MFKGTDIHKAKKRKRIFDVFGHTYYGLHDLSKNGSFNCGCGVCNARTEEKRINNRKNRRESKLNLKKEYYGKEN